MAVTDDEGARGVLRIQMGSISREVPVLPVVHARKWVQRAWDIIAEVSQAALAGGESVDTDGPAATENLRTFIRAMDELSVDRLIDLLVEYDRTNVLGGRDTIEAMASPRQIHRAIEVMRSECLPFGDDENFVTMLARMLAQMSAARYLNQSSTNGRSPTGVSPRDHLKKRSRTASSGSSGSEVRSASDASVAST